MDWNDVVAAAGLEMAEDELGVKTVVTPHHCWKDARVAKLEGALRETKSLASSMDGSALPGTYWTIWDVAQRALAEKPEPTTLYSGAESVREHARKVAARATVAGDEDTSDNAQKPGSPRGSD